MPGANVAKTLEQKEHAVDSIQVMTAFGMANQMELIKLPLLCPASCLPSCLLLLCGMSMVYISSYRGLVAPYTRMYTSHIYIP
jgi:hypothetical protein